METSYGPETDLPALERRIHEIEARLVSGHPGLETASPEVSAWTPAEHLFHLALANELSLNNAFSLHRRHGRLIREPQDVQAEAQRLLVEGHIPPGNQAPRFVTPPKRIDMDLLLELVQGNRSLISDLEGIAPELVRAPNAIPHQLIGDLTAVQWVRFAHVHTNHHWAIVGRISEAQKSSRKG